MNSEVEKKNDACIRAERILKQFFNENSLSGDKAHSLYQRFMRHAQAPKIEVTAKTLRYKRKNKKVGGCPDCLEHLNDLMYDLYTDEHAQGDIEFVERSKREGISKEMFERYYAALLRYDAYHLNIARIRKLLKAS